MRTSGPVGFDLDLTLINSRPAIMAAWSQVALQHGVAIDLEQVDSRMGVKLEDEVAYWFPPHERELAAESYRVHYVRLAPDNTFLLPGAAEAVAAVRAAGERAVVVTAKHPVSVEPSLAAVGLRPDSIYPHVHGPEKGRVLASIGAAVYVGDTPADMSAGVTGGTVAVGVPTGSFSPADLKAAGAHLVLGSMTDFPAWYGAFRGGTWQPGPAGTGEQAGPRAR